MGLKDRQFEVSVAAESEPEEDMTIVSRGEITAKEMAIEADLDPKPARHFATNSFRGTFTMPVGRFCMAAKNIRI